MKKKWPVCALFVLLCLVMLCSIPVYAAETRASDRINLASVTLGQKSNGDLSIFFSVRATGTMEKIGASSVAIQRNWGVSVSGVGSQGISCKTTLTAVLYK